jgi:hypothetical protein
MADLTAMLQAAAGAGGEYQISRSLRFNSADSAYLSRTPASASNRKTWTWSGWVKRGLLGGDRVLFGAWNGADRAAIKFENDNKIQYYEFVGGSVPVNISSTALFRDLSGWYHVVITANTDSSAITIYVNNNAVVNGSVSAGYTTFINQAIAHGIGTETNGTYDGYLAEIHFIDGQALTPSSFGEFNATTGVWSPIAYAGSYGTNGFYLNFSDNTGVSTTTLGEDQAGSNNWTLNNFSVTAGAGNDSLVDTPTQYGTDTGAGGEVRGNYCTYNPIGLGGGTLSNGNLTLVVASGTTPAVGTFAMTTGKWYWEVTLTTSDAPRVGVFDVGSSNPAGLGETAFGWAIINSTSRTFHNNSTTSYGTFDGNNGDVVMLAYDADAGKLWYGVNGSFFASGNPATGANPSQSSVTGNAIVPANGFGGGSSNTHNANFGQRPFAYTAPSGFKALVTTNLPEPTVVQGDDYFNTVLYTGTGSSLGVTGVGFQPDWVWIKERSGVADHGLYDAVRGTTKQLESNNTDAETTEATGLTAFGADGFTVGALAQLNTSADVYVAWNWKANGAGVSNTDGTITSTVSANTTAGISIVTYTGTGANATVGHGLGVQPFMVIVKNRDNGAAGWYVEHIKLTGFGTYTIFLNQTSAESANSAHWNDTAPTSSVFSVGTSGGTNESGSSHVAYCFAEVEGFSKFGSYTGNGIADGPFVFLNFRPKFILTKRSDTADDWNIIDTTRSPYNEADAVLFPNLSNAELDWPAGSSDRSRDILSNGFKVRDTNAEVNASGGTYIYMAFAENPFKNSLAR